ncbi:UNVERIFIED_CONTAM: Polypeptide N-acetylgalactosaminyltransferase-like 6, partial [Eudyptes robustus]
CKRVNYVAKLPSVTVIFPFHNEHKSALLRSVYSILNRSPKGVLQEIILVDDASSKEELKQPLQDYLNVHDLSGIVKIVRTKKREGLIRARQIGATAATKEVLVFLDAHSEANYNWLPPLVEPITLDYRTIVCPFVDIVDCNTYEYKSQDEGARGSFDWSFNYKRLPLTKEDQINPIKPFKSPVMAGGYFAISAKWFWELGGYDEGLDIWGGEQYELSFKTWQCHGKMVDAPCSRVGHIYRCKYIPFPNPGVGDFISRNYKRVAEVWMDEYKEFLYKRRPEMKDVSPGNLTKQLAIRAKLKCNSFDWFMKNVAFDQDLFYPNVEPPDSANGELKNVEVQKCVDTQFKGNGETFGLKPCLSESTFNTGEQELRMGFQLDIRGRNDKNLCFDVSQYQERAPVLLFGCHGTKGNQLFRYLIEYKQILHPVSNLCLDADPKTDEIFMSKCLKAKRTQKWEWKYLNKTLMEKRNSIPM